MAREKRYSRWKPIEEQKDRARQLYSEFDMDKKYTNRSFDKMLFPLYSYDGRPFMDQFEYIDAVFHNEDVEKLRKQYFDKKRIGRAGKWMKKRDRVLALIRKSKPNRADTD